MTKTYCDICGQELVAPWVYINILTSHPPHAETKELNVTPFGYVEYKFKDLCFTCNDQILIGVKELTDKLISIHSKQALAEIQQQDDNMHKSTDNVQ